MKTKTRQNKKKIQSQFTYKEKNVQTQMIWLGIFVTKSVHTTIEPQLTTEGPLPIQTKPSCILCTKARGYKPSRDWESFKKMPLKDEAQPVNGPPSQQ